MLFLFYKSKEIRRLSFYLNSDTLFETVSLVPSRYIEFVDRDSDIDYETVMQEAAASVSELLSRQKENIANLQKAFEVLGFNLDKK